MVSCWAAFLALAGAQALHVRLYGHPGHWDTGQVTNIVLLLITVSAASTFVAQHPQVRLRRVW